MFNAKAPDGSNNLCGKQILTEMEKRSLSQQQLAIQLQLMGLKIHKNAISGIVNGKRHVTDIEATFFANLFGLTLEELFYGKSDIL